VAVLTPLLYLRDGLDATAAAAAAAMEPKPESGPGRERRSGDYATDRRDQIRRWALRTLQFQQEGHCWKGCPKGFRDDGLFCAKPAAYGRGGGSVMHPQGCPAGYTDTGLLCTRCTGWFPWEWHCDTVTQDLACDAGEDENLGLCYTPCREGFHNVGCCICSPDCPAGMEDIGVSCLKDIHGRTNSCPAAMPSECGAGCTKDTWECDAHTEEIIMAAHGVAQKMISLAATIAFPPSSLFAVAKKLAMKGVSHVANYALAYKAVLDAVRDYPPYGKLVNDLVDAASHYKNSGYYNREHDREILLEVVADAVMERYATTDVHMQAFREWGMRADPTGIWKLVDVLNDPSCDSAPDFPALEYRGDASRHAKFAAATTATTVAYCHRDSFGWFIAKTQNEPGWTWGNTCHATSGGTTDFNELACVGGPTLAACEQQVRGAGLTVGVVS
jgi:hypothetical protein